MSDLVFNIEKSTGKAMLLANCLTHCGLITPPLSISFVVDKLFESNLKKNI